MSILEPKFPTLSATLKSPRISARMTIKTPLRKAYNKTIDVKLNDFYGKYSDKFEKSEIFTQKLNNKCHSDRKVMTSQALKRLPLVFKELNEANEKLKKYIKPNAKDSSKSIQEIKNNSMTANTKITLQKKNSQSSISLASSFDSENNLNDNNSQHNSNHSQKNFYHGSFYMNSGMIESKVLQKSQNIEGIEGSNNDFSYNYMDEKRIVREIDSNIGANHMKDPIFSDIRKNKQELNELKFENDKKTKKLKEYIKTLESLDKNEDMKMYREEISILKREIEEETEKIKKAQFEKERLEHMIWTRKHDLNLMTLPVIEELKIVPDLCKKIDQEISSLETNTKILDHFNNEFTGLQVIAKQTQSEFYKLDSTKRTNELKEIKLKSLLEQEKLIRLRNTENEMEEKKNEDLLKERMRRQENEKIKSKQRELIETLQKQKDEIFKVHAVTGHYDHDNDDILKSIDNFRNMGGNLSNYKNYLEEKLDQEKEDLEILKKKFETLRLQNNEDIRTKDYFEKSLENETRELELIESKVLKDNELIASIFKGFLNITYKLSSSLSCLPKDLQKRIRILQKINKNIAFEDYCQELSEVILLLKDRKSFELSSPNENLLLPDSKQKVNIMTKSELRIKDERKNRPRNLTECKDKRNNQ